MQRLETNKNKESQNPISPGPVYEYFIGDHTRLFFNVYSLDITIDKETIDKETIPMLLHYLRVRKQMLIPGNPVTLLHSVDFLAFHAKI